jgi:two-component system chemotaxis response regulator CheB
LRVKHAEDGEPLEPGRLYVCVGDFHLLVGSGHVHVKPGPRENGSRPAVDPLFRSAAAHYGPRAIGVVLSGTLSDGTAGLFSIQERGGVTIVQDPKDALFDGMPKSAIEYLKPDFILPASDIGPLMSRLVKEQVDGGGGPLRPHLRREVELMEGNQQAIESDHPGRPSPWPCPDCSGVLWEIEDGPILRFRCRVGHAWAADNLLEQQAEGVEGALWMALRALEDRAALSRKLAERADASGRGLSAARYRQDLGGMTHNIDILRRLLRGARAAEGESNA